MIQINAMGDACPIPVVKTKKAIAGLAGAGEVAVLVDNEIAVQNLTKMAKQKDYGVRSEKLGEGRYRVVMDVNAEQVLAAQSVSASGQGTAELTSAQAGSTEEASCAPAAFRGNTVVVISSSFMGNGDDKLGAVLMKGFLYAVSQQDVLPQTILFYNGGAKLTCESSPTLEDLRSMEAQGVEILTCGTCLNHYGLTDRLQVGGVTNMYVIAEKMMQAERIVRP